MEKKLVVLTAAFALTAGLVFAQALENSVTEDSNAEVNAVMNEENAEMMMDDENAELNAEEANAEMNAAAPDTDADAADVNAAE